MIAMVLIGAGLFFASKNLDSGNDKMVSDAKFSQYDSIFKSIGAKYGVPWMRLKRISWIESKVGTYKSVAIGIKNPKNVKESVSQDGKSWGIMQVTLKTGADYDRNISPEKLNDVSYSIDLAAQHLKMLSGLFINERDIVMAYNHGQGNQKNFLIKEKNRTLLEKEYTDGKNYFAEYNKAKGIVG